MDLSDALFSPSKARQQQAQAKDWIFVDSWLSKKYYPKPVPDFERNEDTLQALLTLVAFNERADEEHALVEKVEKHALKELEEKTYDPINQDIYSRLDSALDDAGKEAVLAQAEATVILHSPSTSAASLAHRAVELTVSQYELDQKMADISYLQQALVREQKHLEALLQEIRSDSFTAPAELGRQTTTWTRDTKMLQLKLDEYNERLSQYRSIEPPRPSIVDVEEGERELQALKQRLTEVEEKVRSFQGLPPDIGEARMVLEGLKSELRGLVNRRNTGFEDLMEVGGGRSRLPIRRS